MRCETLESIRLDAPLLQEPKADKNPRLKTLILKPISLYVMGSFDACSSLDLEKAKKENVIGLLEGIKVPVHLLDYLFRLYCNDPGFNELILTGTEIGDEGAKALSKALASNSSLTSINLNRNIIGDTGTKIGDEGAKALSKVIASNSSLTSIYLFGNNIGDKGAKALGKALSSNSSLTSTNLRENNIGDEGAMALGEAFVTNSSLTKINLWNNNIGDMGAKALSLALASNSSLTSIGLGGNYIDSLIEKEIKKSLELNKQLKIRNMKAERKKEKEKNLDD